jgi:hypothetical protein
MVGLINLCTPAYVYLVLSIILLIVMFCQNMYNGVNVFCLGSQECNITDSTNIYLIKIILIIFWTWVLNIICKEVTPTISWLLILFPFVVFFIFMGSVFVGDITI